jgi:hypothetical protein
MSIGQELLDVPMGEMIRSMAFAIAEAQLKLDQASIESAEMMGGLKTVVDDQGKVIVTDSRIYFGHDYVLLADANKVLPAEKRSPELAQAIADATAANLPATAEIRVPTRISMMELGFAPVFYSFIDTIIEVKIAIKISQETESTTSTTDTSRTVAGQTSFRGLPFLRGSVNRTRNVSTSQVNATYSSKYSYSAEGSSLLRTKLAPVPTPGILDERIRAIMDADRLRNPPQVQPSPAPPP